MPEVEYATTMNAPPDVVWEFVKDMNNWAPFLTGYQKHEILSDTDSVWTLKGDVGILSRVVKLKAHVVEWRGPDKVAFTLTGLNEEVDGSGTLLMSQCTAVVEAPVRVGFFRRIGRSIVRFFFRLVNRRSVAQRAATPAGMHASQLKFTLRMEARGPTGPLVNALLGPALMPAAEDLANKIAAHLDRAHLGGAPAQGPRP